MVRQSRCIPLFLLLSAAVFAAGCGSEATDEAATGPTVVSSNGPVEETREVVLRHLDRFGGGDLEGIVADYAEDAVLFTPNGPLRGHEELRAAFEQFFVEWGQEGVTFELTDEHYVGNYGYYSWVAETPDNIYHYGVDGFVVRDGKIVVQFFGAHLEPNQ
ncbi:MAG: nuclear transport factor 2 family protein [Rhodothermales bacterium]